MSEGVGPVIRSKRELAVELHRLLFEAERRSGGRGTLKRAALARRIGVSASSLYAYLDGTTLPSTTALDLLLDEIGASGAQRHRLSTARDALETDRRVRRREPWAPGGTAPHELPPDVTGFIGREEQLAELTELLAAGDTAPSAAVVAAISGTGGVGKTALAVHWAHRVRDRFPDGQLYVDLRGYDPDEPVPPAEALGTLLRSLGVDGPGVPPGLADRIARYRTLLDRRCTLVVLDNAFSAEQIRPLLPGSSSCRVVVTSRDSLSGLVARDGARRLRLDRLPQEEAVGLLRTLLGAARVDDDAQAAAGLAARCERLPLALRVAAELAASRPTESLAELVAELDRHRLDLLDGGDNRTAVRSVLSWSCRQLPAAPARAFRLIGLHPGHDLDAPALAALADTDLDAARESILCLRDAHLLEPGGSGRFRTHDLLREYAAELVSADPESARRDALARLLDHYAHATSRAVNQIYPYETLPRPQVPPPRTSAPALTDDHQAARWLDTELANLLAATHAADRDHPAHTLYLSAALRRHLRTRASYADAGALHGLALHTARRIGDRSAELDALAALGHVHRLQGRPDAAADCFQQALDLAVDLDDRGGRLHALTGLGHTHYLCGRGDLAAHYYRQALDLAREAGDRSGQLNALTGLGHNYCVLGRHDPAADCFRRALDLAREAGDRSGQLTALTGLGHAHRLQGRPEPAADCFRHALDLARAAGHRAGELTALTGLGHAHRLQGRPDPAADRFRQALDLAGKIGDRNLQFEAQHGLGHTHLTAGRPDQALTAHRRALDLSRDLSHPADHARAHDGLARAHHALGQPEPARQHWQRALTLLTDLDVTDVEGVNTDDIRARLRELS